MQRHRGVWLVSCLLLAASGCEYQAQARGLTMIEPPPRSLRLVTPETSYHLSAADRARVVPGFDGDALERLLRMVRPDMRQEILAHFQVPDGTGGRDLGQLVAFHDPQLQSVLEEVWAPMWDHVGATDEQLEKDVYGWPGREVARQRRAAARPRQGQSGS